MTSPYQLGGVTSGCDRVGALSAPHGEIEASALDGSGAAQEPHVIPSQVAGCSHREDSLSRSDSPGAPQPETVTLNTEWRYPAGVSPGNVTIMSSRPRNHEDSVKIDAHHPGPPDNPEVRNNRRGEARRGHNSGRLRAEFPDDPEMWVSTETIYQSLCVQSRGALTACLRTCLPAPSETITLMDPARSGPSAPKR